MQRDLFSNTMSTFHHLKLQDGDVLHIERFYAHNESNTLFQRLKNEIYWQQDQIRIYGKTHKLPRLTCWMGEKNLAYSYSGIRMIAKGWSDLLFSIKQKVENELSIKFNSCLLNYYRNGQDHMGWHQDNEATLGKNPVIASLTFGETRPFQLKHLYDQSLAMQTLHLKHGDLLLMRGTTQHYWQHQIPKTKKHMGARINLTFRKVIQSIPTY
ncbi:alpha-ketoglutarate-dependent dioxygenase AlkB [Flavobacteriaceae bacterium F08102]|nr:alpha-ketoglutarate-dependent dioxygenase AlkB [Flavobacteriaceae bacterium F08102]